MKYNNSVTSSRRKNRKAHFTAHSTARAKIMSAPLSKELRAKYGVRAVPIRKDDVVKVVRGKFGQLVKKEGKVTQVYRKKYIVHIERITKDKNTGVPANIGFHPSNLVITQLSLDPDRSALLERKRAGKAGDKNKGKISDAEVAGTAQLD